MHDILDKMEGNNPCHLKSCDFVRVLRPFETLDCQIRAGEDTVDRPLRSGGMLLRGPQPEPIMSTTGAAKEH
uniref:Protein kinase domain-containing protein n=1 Tax=Panagrellus redivivus TaxID=6233 RepID=A0A7E4WAU1_PANRE